MAAKFYDDVGVDSNDLLSKGFPSAGVFKVTAETKTADGVSLTSTGRRFIKDKAVAVELGFEPKLELSKHNVEVSATANTSADYSATASIKDIGVKGSKITASASSGAKGISYKATAAFKNDNVALKLATTCTLGHKPVLFDGSVVGVYEKKLFVGLTGNYATAVGDQAASLKWGAKAGGEHGDIQAHGFVSTTEQNLLVGMGFYQKVSNNVKVAANVTLDAKQVAGPAGTLGVEYKFDNLSTLKSKVGVQTHSNGTKPFEARLGLGLKQVLSPNLTCTIGADVNIRKTVGVNAGADHSFGVDLKFA